MKAILFDLEGTLVETMYARLDPEVVDQERRAVKKKLISLGVPEDVFEGLVRHTLFRNKAFDWVDANMSRDEAFKFHAELDKFIRNVEMRAVKQHRLFPDTLKSLSMLNSEGFEMGIATNVSKEAADYLLRKFNLEEFFKVVVTRNDASRLKPDPEIIHVAIKRMGTPVEWFIGDDVFDAEAAYNAGVKSIIVRYNNIRPSFRYDYFASSLNEVASFIMKSTK